MPPVSDSEAANDGVQRVSNASRGRRDPQTLAINRIHTVLQDSVDELEEMGEFGPEMVGELFCKAAVSTLID